MSDIHKKSSLNTTPKDRPAGRKFNPYLTPTESEDDPKLIEEDDSEKPSTAGDEDEGYEESFDENAGIEGTEGESGSEEEVIVQEEEYDERHQESEKEREKVTKQETPGPRSWGYQAAGVLFIMLFGDLAALRLGSYFFWTPRSVYVLSYAVRTVALLIAAYVWHRSIFRDNRRDLMIVFVWIGLISGSILAILRFMISPSFWSFINMAVEPLDSMLLAFFVAFCVTYVGIQRRMPSVRSGA